MCETKEQKPTHDEICNQIANEIIEIFLREEIPIFLINHIFADVRGKCECLPLNRKIDRIESYFHS